MREAIFEAKHALPPIPRSMPLDDNVDEDDDFEEGEEPRSCEANCCDKDCECDDCTRCASNSLLNPFDEDSTAGVAAA